MAVMSPFTTVHSSAIMLTRWATDSSPTMPESRNVTTPVSRFTIRFPGCGSAWKKPSMSIILIAARSAFSPITTRSRPAASMAATLEILTPEMYSWVRTRMLDRSRCRSGTCTPGSSAMFAASRDML